MYNLNHEKRTFWVAFAVACAIFFSISWWLAFHVTYNDFWGILFFARHLSWQEKASLYNGFYPIGYALMLRLLPYGLVIQGMTIINIIFGGILSATTTQLTKKTGSIWIALLIFGLSISYPLIVEYATSVPPEIGCAGFTALAVFLLWEYRDSLQKDVPQEQELMPKGSFPQSKIENRQSKTSFAPLRLAGSFTSLRLAGSFTSLRLAGSFTPLFLAGLFLGLSTLWRNHTIVSSAAIVVAYLLTVHKIPVRGKINFLVGFITILAIQVVINIISGHAPFETAQNFNLYKLFNLVDWRNMPRTEDIASFSLVSTFFLNPGQVLSIYLPAMFKVLVYAWPAAIGLLLFSNSKYRDFWQFSALSISAYALIIAFGGSSRAPLVIISLLLTSIGFLLAEIGEKNHRWHTPLQGCAVIICVFFILFFTKTSLEFIRFAKSQDENISGLASILAKAGMDSPDEVFTDSFAIYFPGMPPYAPRMFGGWNEYFLWGYNDVYPKIPITTSAAFDKACQEQGIKFLILSPKSDQSADFLYSLYTNPAAQSDSLPTFEFVRKFGNFKIFKRAAALP